MDVTLLELNVDGIQLSTGGDGGVALTDDEAESSPESEGRPWLAALIGLLFLAVLAELARRRLGGKSA
ncbi:hypothetical protein [Halosegnis sp.]|uniref:hypothetical protein n=1 Tax=Halosegnis sp. TaxID=2864959 RepID=UPI0035D451ED